MNKHEDMKLDALDWIVESLKSGYCSVYGSLALDIIENLIIYREEAEEALEAYGIYDALGKIQKNQQEQYGRIYTDLGDPEYIYLALCNVVIDEVMESIENLPSYDDDSDADDETNEQLLKEIKAFYLAEIEAGNIDSESEPYIKKIVLETTV